MIFRDNSAALRYKSREMKIVILDAFTTNPGDLDWEPISALGDLTAYDRTPATQTLERIREADAVLLNKATLSRKAIEGAANLKYIGVLATGYNTVDLEAARERDIIVTNVPDYSSAAVAQHTFALILELTNHVALHNQDVHKGGWCDKSDYCYQLRPILELQDLTLGVIGLGHIGKAVARIGRALGMHILIYRQNPTEPLPPGMQYVEKDQLLAESDIVSLHCPLTEDTFHIIDEESLDKMKPTAYLINTARGPLIDEEALADALQQKRIAGAAVDVLSTEPPSKENPLLDQPNAIITPHIAWAAKASRQRLIHVAAENIAAWQAGNPIHRVGVL